MVEGGFLDHANNTIVVRLDAWVQLAKHGTITLRGPIVITCDHALMHELVQFSNKQGIYNI